MSAVYLIPSLLSDDGIKAIPAYVLETVKSCQVFFVENERTARRYLKKLSKEIIIDDYEWHVMSEDISVFEKCLAEQKSIGIISEAGCPGVADPGQWYVAEAQRKGAMVRPLVGPNSILLALMASGMNGQHFKFNGYLPIPAGERAKKIRQLEQESANDNCTQVFIETPYRNNQLLETILNACRPGTLLCIASNLTANDESIITKTVSEWKTRTPDLHKIPAIFLLHS
jgi:16S rRNA (cytidine1402-2'-O)-methyltransferase